MVSFGVPSYGCHVNGFTRKMVKSAFGWRSALSKPTYPGLLDQTRGGLPAKMLLLENAKREAAEEASIPRDILDEQERRAACRTARRRAGPRRRRWAVFDLELPEDLVPINGDGEVDAFMLMKAEDAPEPAEPAVRGSQSATVMLDFVARWATYHRTTRTTLL